MTVHRRRGGRGGENRGRLWPSSGPRRRCVKARRCSTFDRRIIVLNVPSSQGIQGPVGARDSPETTVPGCMMIRSLGAVVLRLGGGGCSRAGGRANAVWRPNPLPAARRRGRRRRPGAPSRILPYPDEADAALPPPAFAQPRGRRVGMPSYVRRVPSALVRPLRAAAAPAGAAAPVPPAATAALPPEDQPEIGNPKELPPNLTPPAGRFPHQRAGRHHHHRYAATPISI